MPRFRLLFVLLATLTLAGWAAPSYAAPPTAPALAYTATARISDAHPHHNERVTVTGTLRGTKVAGATMTATWHYKTTTSTCTGLTNTKGVASCTRDISRATSGRAVAVTIRFTRAGATLASTATSFTPR